MHVKTNQFDQPQLSSKTMCPYFYFSLIMFNSDGFLKKRSRWLRNSKAADVEFKAEEFKGESKDEPSSLQGNDL
jgi:hypothetical protein